MKNLLLTMLLVLVGGAGSVAWADPTAQNIPGSLDLSNGTYSGGSWNGTNTTDIPKNGTATYILKNTTAQAYKITINSVSKNANAQLRVTIKNGETTVSERTVTTLGTGGWTSYQDFVCFTSVLPVAEELTMVVSFLNEQTNIKSITFAVPTSSDLQIPTDVNRYPFDPALAVITGSNSKVTESGTFDSFQNGNTATFTVNNTSEQVYLITFAAATNNDKVSVKFTIKQGETVISDGDAVAITKAGWSSYKNYECQTKAALPTGELKVIVTFNRIGGSYTANVKNIGFWPIRHTPDADIFFRTSESEGSYSWVSGYPKDAASVGDGTMAGHLRVGMFVLQKYTVENLKAVKSLYPSLRWW